MAHPQGMGRTILTDQGWLNSATGFCAPPGRQDEARDRAEEFICCRRVLFKSNSAMACCVYKLTYKAKWGQTRSYIGYAGRAHWRKVWHWRRKWKGRGKGEWKGKGKRQRAI